MRAQGTHTGSPSSLTHGGNGAGRIDIKDSVFERGSDDAPERIALHAAAFIAK